MRPPEQTRVRLNGKSHAYFSEQIRYSGYPLSVLVSRYVNDNIDKDIEHSFKVGDRIQYSEHFASQCVQDTFNNVSYQISIPKRLVGVLVKSTNRNTTYFEVTHVFSAEIWGLLKQEGGILESLIQLETASKCNQVSQYYQQQTELKVGDTLPGSFELYTPVVLLDGCCTPALYAMPDHKLTVQRVYLPPTYANLALPEIEKYIYVITRIGDFTSGIPQHKKDKLSIGTKLNNKEFKAHFDLDPDGQQFKQLCRDVTQSTVVFEGNIWKKVGKYWVVTG